MNVPKLLYFRIFLPLSSAASCPFLLLSVCLPVRKGPLLHSFWHQIDLERQSIKGHKRRLISMSEASDPHSQLPDTVFLPTIATFSSLTSVTFTGFIHFSHSCQWQNLGACHIQQLTTPTLKYSTHMPLPNHILLLLHHSNAPIPLLHQYLWSFSPPHPA